MNGSHDAVESETFRRADGRLLTALQLKVYARAGLTPQEGVVWADAGIEPYQAEAFRAMGVALADASSWVERGVSGQRYASWVRAGLDPEVEAARPTPTPVDATATPTYASSERRLVSTSDIAAMAKVETYVVSKWRERHSDTFPKPVVEGRRKLFDADAVRTWLAGRGREVDEPGWLGSRTLGQLALEAGLGRDALAALVLTGAWAPRGARADAAEVDPFLDLASSARTLKSRLHTLAAELEATRDELAGLVVDVVDGVRATGSRLVPVVRSIAGQLRDEPATGVLDGALEVMAAAGTRDAVTWTAHGVAELMVTLACRPGGSVLDPAAGEGELLIWSAGRSGPEASRHGSDLDPVAWRVARIRLLLRGLPADLRLADTLAHDPFTGGRFDAVLVDPPLQGDTPVVDWVRYAVTHLSDGGRAVVALPARSGPRSALAKAFKRREVEAVVLLAASARSDARGPLGVALVGGRSERFERVLVVDLRRSSRSVWTRQALASTVSYRQGDRLPLDWIESALDDFRRGATEFEPGPIRHDTRAVVAPTVQVLSANADALVQFLGRDPAAPRRPSRTQQLAARLERQLVDDGDPASEELRRALAAYLRQTDS
jgi:hypothetical protein